MASLFCLLCLCAHLPDTRQLSPATPACSSVWYSPAEPRDTCPLICLRRHTCLSNCPASQPSNGRLLGEQEQFYLFPFLLFKGDFVKTVQLVTIVELWLPRGLYISKHEGICVAIKHATCPNHFIFLIKKKKKLKPPTKWCSDEHTSHASLSKYSQKRPWA